MSIYKFVRPSRYFNGVCSSTLLYEDKDGDKKRLPCVTETCIDAYFSGTAPITSCRTSMLPVGYTNRLFTWGVEGGPWTMSLSYGEHYPYSGNEFNVYGGALSRVEPPVTTSNVIATGVYPYYRPNMNCFSNRFDVVDPGKTGYQAMANQNLNGYVVDPTKMGGDYEPVLVYYFGVSSSCGVRYPEKLFEPQIEYFDVGVNRSPPRTHDIVFNYAYVRLSGMVFPYPNMNPGTAGYTYWDTYFKNAEESRIATQGTSQTWVAGVHPNPLATEYSDWAYSGVPNVNRDITLPNEPQLDQRARAARVYHPRKDNVQTAGGPLIRGICWAPIFHTGYRMQRFVQEKQAAVFSRNYSHLIFGLRHIESRMYPYGYYANWTVKSIEPQLTAGYFNYNGGQWYWNSYARAKVTLTVTYRSFTTLIPAKFLYEYGPIRASNPYNCMDIKLESPTYNEPLQGWDWEVYYCSIPVQNRGGIVPPTSIGGTHCFYNGNAAGTQWYSTISHSATVIPSDNSVLDPQSQQRVNYYTWPLSWESGTYPLYHTSHYVLNFDPSRISYGGVTYSNSIPDPNVKKPYSGARNMTFVGTPNNFKFWRRLI